MKSKLNRPATLAVAPGSAKYVDCKCIQCGWLDGFKQDVITQGLVGGWCETCGRETVFRASEPPIDPR